MAKNVDIELFLITILKLGYLLRLQQLPAKVIPNLYGCIIYSYRNSRHDESLFEIASNLCINLVRESIFLLSLYLKKKLHWT